MNKTVKHNLPVLAALLCAGIGVASMVGWLVDLQRLTSVIPGLPSMVPLTALQTLLASWALWLNRHAGARNAGLPQALLLVLLAAAILAAYGAARLGLLDAPIVRRGILGVSSPLTATLFVGIGLSLAALSRPRLLAHAQWLALAVLTLAGYLFRDTSLYYLLPGTGTSIPTLAVAIMLSSACLGARPREGILAAVSGRAAGAQVARRLLLSAVAMPVLAGMAMWTALHLELVDTDTGIALLIWSIVAFLVVSTWRNAMRLSRAEAALGSALQALRDADANKDRFMAVLAHELRNPLAPLRSAADLLRLPAGVDAAQQRRTGDIVARQVDAMSHLIEDLLDVSRIRQGLIVIDRVPVDLHDVVGDALEQTRAVMAARRQRLHAELPDVHPRILGDRKRLVQVLTNLLVNAARYTPEGGEIVLSLQLRDGQADIVVRDNGIGVEADMLEHIFDSFTQAERDPERGKGGLGLGLSLVKRLVELHGGTVSASSAGAGRGSAFTVTLPVAVPAQGL